MDNYLCNRQRKHSLEFSSAIRRTIQTGITYLPLPEQNELLAKTQSDLTEIKRLDEVFSSNLQHFDEEELDSFLSTCSKPDRQRYKSSYRNLYKNTLLSMVNCVEMNQKINDIEKLKIELEKILPIYAENRRLAELEQKILSNLVDQSWRKFEKVFEREIFLQSQLEQLREEHDKCIQRKIAIEQSRIRTLNLHEIRENILKLETELHTLYESRSHLETKLMETRTRQSYLTNQVEILQQHHVRTLQKTLNQIRMENQFLTKQTESLRNDLIEHIHRSDDILNEYRLSFHTFRLNFHQLEQQLKQQTDDEFQCASIEKFSSTTTVKRFSGSLNRSETIHSRYSTIPDDSQRLILLFETQNQEIQAKNRDLEMKCQQFQEKLLTERQEIASKEIELRSIRESDQKITVEIQSIRDQSSDFKNQCRLLEQKWFMLFQKIPSEIRLNDTLKSKLTSLTARQRFEFQHFNDLTGKHKAIIDEKNIFEIQFKHLTTESLKINEEKSFDSSEKLVELRQIKQKYVEELEEFDRKEKYFLNFDEQIRMKISDVKLRLNGLLQRMNEHVRTFEKNRQNIELFENKRENQQHEHSRLMHTVMEMKNHCQTQQMRRQKLDHQIKIAENHIRHSQQRLQVFDEQLAVCYQDLLSQKIFLNKINEFHFILQEQDQSNLKKLSQNRFQMIYLQRQYEISQQRLLQTNAKLVESIDQRSSLGQMVIRRMHLCQLLYQNLVQLENRNEKRREHIELLSKCRRSMIKQIQYHRSSNKRFLDEQKNFQRQLIDLHLTKLDQQSCERSLLFLDPTFPKQITAMNSDDRLPIEEIHYLRAKFSRLARRLFAIICRNVIAHLTLISIEKNFIETLKISRNTGNEEQLFHLQFKRHELDRLMRQLKAKRAEGNMLIDYRTFFHWIQFDIFQQFTQWTNILNDEVAANDSDAYRS